MDEDSTIKLYDGVRLLRNSTDKDKAVYKQMSEDTSRPLEPWLVGNKDSLPMAPPSSARMKVAPVAAPSTGCLVFDAEGSLTFPESVSDMKAAEPVMEVVDAEV